MIVYNSLLKQFKKLQNREIKKLKKVVDKLKKL